MKKPILSLKNVKKKQAAPGSLKNQKSKLSDEKLLEIYDLMVKSRALEDRLIKIYKAGESYFWIGGPGEEAWGVPLGLLAHKGQGIQFDYMHLHYRATPTLIAMGMSMIDAIRLMMNRATDPSTGGRNFSNHYCFPEWNVAPITSPIEVQYSVAIGTAHVQKKNKSKGISIVTGGDAGTAEGDFASCLVWSSRKDQELPILITVQNNLWGISTSYHGQHGENSIADRANAFQIKSCVIDANDPETSYETIEEYMTYIRETGKPAFIEAKVSRLYGHSSASGANFISHEVDPISLFEKKLLKRGLLTEKTIRETRERYDQEGIDAQTRVRAEAAPNAESIWDHVYADGTQPNWRKF